MEERELQSWMCEYPALKNIKKKKEIYIKLWRKQIKKRATILLAFYPINAVTSMQTGQFCLETFSTH